MPASSRMNGRTQGPAAPTPTPAPRAPGGGRGNGYMQDLLRERGAGAPSEAPACTPTGPTGDYVTMGGADKAGYLAELFRTPEVSSTFDQRGFNGTDQSRLAAVMQNEGGLNERRRMLSSHYGTAARSLTRKLTAAGRDASRLDGAEADPKLRLTEDERAVLTAAQQGKFDLAALGGPAGDSREQAQSGLTQAGIDHQVGLYDEYSGLDARQRGGGSLSRQEQARMSTLSNRTLYSSGDLADARGMSSARFRGVYDEGQTRFEPDRFRRSRNAVERWTSGGEKGEGGRVGAGGERAKDWVGRHPEARDGNHDALADAETSWGTAQIMGHYADRGDLNTAAGGKFTMDDMRGSAARRSPNATDVDMQISYFRDVARVPGHLGSPEDIAVQYNGPDAPPSYAAGIRSNASRYDSAREGLDPACPPGDQSLLDSGVERYS